MIILLILALVQFTSIVDFMVVMPLGPVMIEELSIRADQFSMIVASYSISAGVAGLLASSIMDRFGRKLAYMSLFAGFLVGTLACGLTNSYATLVAARALTGAFGGILGGLGLTIVADVFPEEQRGRATGLLMSAFALASVVGVPVGLQLGDAFPLAGAVPGTGGPGLDHFRRRSARDAPLARASSSHGPQPPDLSVHHDVSPAWEFDRLCTDGERDAGRVHGDSIHQPVAGRECGRAEKKTLAGFPDGRIDDPGRSTA